MLVLPSAFKTKVPLHKTLASQNESELILHLGKTPDLVLVAFYCLHVQSIMCYLWRDLPLVIVKLYSMYLERSKSKSRTHNFKFWNGTGTVNKYNLIFKFLCMKGTEVGVGIQNFWQNKTERGQDQRWGSKFIFKKLVNAFAYPTWCTKIKPNTALLSS